jgi:hypothetical protein
MDWFKLALGAFAIVLAMAVFMYLRPSFVREGFLLAHEGFATHGISPDLPKCFLRDAEAQELLGLFHSVKTPEQIAARDELQLIVQKVLCMDADVTGVGAGIYSTRDLAYATAHDIAPVSDIVGRCVRKAVRSQELEVAFDKFEARGIQLLGVLCVGDASARATTLFHSVLVRSAAHIKAACAAPKMTIEHPADPRDPGYYIPDRLIEYSEYSISGNADQYL